ncbi:type I-E CRISPR-associated protein Cse1/CasA [Anaeromyxobacter paludicola]|uniref:Type I-E CRISPR-associated protein Cse1/CasA n=1 Tax=Anaeromyxobacter paludicola TaxID=2918171 RepID=A0ABN6NA26_9BACT|nr:type I-E CRISPR-associated protein Cse1/CasA [Anaeromyxobacter paludicola]BDG10091.1 type I-E CRISPR-associated protein Cse1/CasA [Anaeromyxobacter paludicola]
MAYNLIDERWIPVLRRSGKVEMISPAQVVEREDPPLRIASPRPDFDGALLEFLIGLLQTAGAPATEREWEDALESPPGVGQLKSRLDAVRGAFFLDGDGPRFMQDLTVAQDPRVARLPIGALLIDRIGEEGLSDSPTLFAKPGLFDSLSLPAAAASLMALQTYAPAGGRGQFTSLRGGGPLTTLILGETLWATAWLNVLPRREFEARVPGDATLTSDAAIFPWMEKTRRGDTPPSSVHPLQHLWGLPRRCRLEIAQSDEEPCAVYGAQAGPAVRGYVGRPEGMSYDGDYRHPWTPYSYSKPGEPWNPKKGSADGLPYRDWPLLVTGSEKRRPATVVSYFASTHRRALLGGVARLVAFGYAMDNMKPLRWCRAETPLVTVDEQLAPMFSGQVEKLVEASEEVRKTLAAQVRAALSDRPADLDVFDQVNPAFWSATEPAFFRTVHAVKAELEAGKTADEPKQAWLSSLHDSALALFDRFTGSSADLAAPDLRRVVLARHSLIHFTSPDATKLRKLLGLSTPNEPTPKAPRGKSASRRPTQESV